MPIERHFQHLLDCETHMRTMTLARDIDENRDEAPELVAPHEGAGPRREIDLEDFLGNAGELIGRDLEKLIPGERLQHVEECPARMAVGRVAGAPKDLAHLLAKEGDVASRKIVCGGGEKPRNKDSTGYVAARVVSLDADRIHMNTAEDRGPAVGLDDDYRRRVQEEGAALRRQAMFVCALPKHRDAIISKQPQPKLRLRNEFAMVLIARVAKLTDPEENEVIDGQPAKKRRGLGIGLRRCGGRIFFELLDRKVEPRRHRGKV